MAVARSAAAAALLLALAAVPRTADSFRLWRPSSLATNGPAQTAVSTSAFADRTRLSETRLQQSRQGYGSSDGRDSEEDEDEYIDDASLGDWRKFRSDLATVTDLDPSASVSLPSSVASSSSSSSSSVQTKRTSKSVSRENEQLLQSQNRALAEEYMSGVWAHRTSTPEVGGLVVRMPLEVELYRNHRRSINGRKLRELLAAVTPADRETPELATWYSIAQQLMEQQMLSIAGHADENGQLDATSLSSELSEMLSLYLDNQETWQEVCLVLEDSRTLVINRPMAMQLTENLANLVLYGGAEADLVALSSTVPRERFLRAFRRECAIYVGGPDRQTQSATLIHGIADLEGATEISPGTKIYQGGLEAAVDGVLAGKYSPLEFRFFVGCHQYETPSALEVAMHLGKYQPVACARSVALKQCISLPKPLWHEVMELCGGELADISELELMKRDDLQTQSSRSNGSRSSASGDEHDAEDSEVDDEDELDDETLARVFEEMSQLLFDSKERKKDGDGSSSDRDNGGSKKKDSDDEDLLSFQ